MKPEHKSTLQKYIATHNGRQLDQKAMLRENPMVAKVLVARYLSMTTQQQQAVEGIVTPETADSLKVLLPELKELINKKVANAAG